MRKKIFMISLKYNIGFFFKKSPDPYFTQLTRDICKFSLQSMNESESELLIGKRTSWQSKCNFSHKI
jgi:hypothetical protein